MIANEHPRPWRIEYRLHGPGQRITIRTLDAKGKRVGTSQTCSPATDWPQHSWDLVLDECHFNGISVDQVTCIAAPHDLLEEQRYLRRTEMNYYAELKDKP